MGVATRELRAKGLPEQVVVAVPLACAIEGLDEEVRLHQRGDLLRRVLATQDGVAQRSRDAIEDGRPQEEGEPLGRQTREQLGGEVVHEIAIVAGHPDRRAGALAGVSERERDKVEGRRPPLRALENGVEVLLCERRRPRA